MVSQVVVYGFETSNNLKVRVALGYKGIRYEFRTIDPAERSEIVRISGQHLTPVLVHRDRVLFDSAAILRYLDANFPGEPRLFGRSRDEQWAIEDWEQFARHDLAGPMMEVVHTRISGGQVDEEMHARCQAAFDVAVTRLAERMAGREWLVEERLSAADITAAAVLFRIRGAALFTFPAGSEGLQPFIERVMAFDGLSRA
jgi:glutathione S-transferase